MKAFPVAIGLGLVFALGACSGGSPEEQVANTIRESLANQTTVDKVEMTKQADGNMTGYVLTHESDGRKGRMKCAAQPDGDSKYKWQCHAEIDAETERQMQEKMRTELAKQGEVLDVAMKRKDDDNHMAGSARIRTADGTEHNLTCTAERQKDANFAWNCEEAGAAPAATDGGEEESAD